METTTDHLEGGIAQRQGILCVYFVDHTAVLFISERFFSRPAIL